MVGSKPYRISTARDRIQKQRIEIKHLEALNRLRNTPRPVAATRAAGSSAAGDTGGGTGNFLPLEGGTMTGNIAFFPQLLAVSDGVVNLDPESSIPKDSTYILVTGQGSPDDIDFINGAAREGQLLYYQGTNQQIQNLINLVVVGAITNIVGVGGNTVRVTLSSTTGLINGKKINVQKTNNFDIIGGTIANLIADTSFEYDLPSTASTTPETAAGIQQGNIATSDGNTLVVDGTTSVTNAPVASLIFDITIGTGAWRVISGGGTGSGGLAEPVRQTIDNPTLETPPTKTVLDADSFTEFVISPLNKSIDIDITGGPTVANTQYLRVQIDVDGVGGYTVNWPAKVPEPPTLDLTANAENTIILDTIDGAVTWVVRSAVSGGGEFFGPWTANHDAGAKSLTKLALGQFVDTGSVVRGSISGDAGASAIRLATVSTGKFIISDVTTDIAEFTDAGGLKMFNKIDLNSKNLETVANLQFVNPSPVAPAATIPATYMQSNSMVHQVDAGGDFDFRESGTNFFPFGD